MSLQEWIFWAAKVLAMGSLALEVGIAIYSVYLAFCARYGALVQAHEEIFEAGRSIRNAAGCFLLLLFFLGNHATLIEGKRVFQAISGVCQLYAIGSLVVLLLGLVLSLLLAWREVKLKAVKTYSKRVWQVGLRSALAAFFFAYLFYLP